nr:piggyBac transposable element-derived protein 4-like [Onthophagus taurus]
MPDLKKKLNKGETVWKSTEKLLALKWKDRRDVTMLFTMHENQIVTLPKLDRKSGDNIKKPLCVLDYNAQIGAVDRSDMLISSIDSMRKNVKWYKKLFFHVLDICLLNSHALFLTQNEKKVPLAVFHKNVIRQLLERDSLQRKVPPRVCHNLKRITDRHFPSLVPKNQSELYGAVWSVPTLPQESKKERNLDTCAKSVM